MKLAGERGELWRKTHCTGIVGSVSPSKDIHILLLQLNFKIITTSLLGSWSCVSIWASAHTRRS